MFIFSHKYGKIKENYESLIVFPNGKIILLYHTCKTGGNDEALYIRDSNEDAIC